MLPFFLYAWAWQLPALFSRIGACAGHWYEGLSRIKWYWSGRQGVTQDIERKIWPSIWRAVRGRCANCGEGKLFQGYLRQVDSCSVCGEVWRDIRADDAPAWATILLTGHILAPFVFPIATSDALPPWMLTMILLTMTAGISLLLLPRAKGAFLAILWARRMGSAANQG